MLLVTQGKRKENQLGFNKKTSEYVYFHRGVEIWREKGDRALLDYFNEVRACIHCFNEEDVIKFPVWNKYIEWCEKYEKE